MAAATSTRSASAPTEVITGQVPFSGATPQLIVAHAQNQPPPPSSVDPGQPHELDVVMARILAKRPEQRFTNGAAFVEALRIVARKHGVAAATPTQLATLVPPPDTSAGQSTVSIGRGATPRAPAPPPRAPTPPRPPKPPIADEPTVAGPPRQSAAPAAAPATTHPTSRRRRLPTTRRSCRPRSARGRRRYAACPRPRPTTMPGASPWALAVPLLGGAVVLVFLFLLLRGVNSANPDPLPTPQVTRLGRDAGADANNDTANTVAVTVPSPTPSPRPW